MQINQKNYKKITDFFQNKDNIIDEEIIESRNIEEIVNENKELRNKVFFFKKNLEETSEIHREKEYMNDFLDNNIKEIDFKLKKLISSNAIFKDKIKNVLPKILLEKEQLKRQEKKEKINSQKHTLGRLVQKISRGKMQDDWEDGNEKFILEEIENLKKQLKTFKKGSKPSLDIEENFGIDENYEKIHLQLSLYGKELSFLTEKLKMFEKEKILITQELRRLLDEQKCKFCKPIPQIFDSAWPLIENRYQILSLLGKGGYGEAFDIEELKEVACKVSQINPNWDENACKTYIKHVEREVNIQSKLKHPNIVKLLSKPYRIDNYSFCIFMELCEGPDLLFYLKKHENITESDAKNIIKQILSGLKYLHEQKKKIIHYDMKPSNILFHKGEIKITDFGLCKVLDENESKLQLTSQGVGTYWYLPPECFNMHYLTDISPKVDIWSVGVIFYEMLYGQKPFGHNLSQEAIVEQNLFLKSSYNLDFPKKCNVTNEAKIFIQKCLESNENERWDVQTAFNCSYIQDKKNKKN